MYYYQQACDIVREYQVQVWDKWRGELITSRADFASGPIYYCTDYFAGNSSQNGEERMTHITDCPLPALAFVFGIITLFIGLVGGYIFGLQAQMLRKMK